MNICKLDDCSSKVKGHGYCDKHYQAWKKHGDPLENHRSRSAPAPKCRVDYCFESARSAGLCPRHYTGYYNRGCTNPVGCDVDISLTSSDPTRKFCTKCMELKLLSEFWVRKRKGVERVDGACKACIGRQAADYRKNREPHHVAEKRRKNEPVHQARRKYGDAGVEIRLRIDNGDPCDICGGHTTKMAIDHNHTTGKVRGLLCIKCNTALGLADDTPERLEAMATYLRSHQ